MTSAETPKIPATQDVAAETARQEGAQGRTGKGPGDTVGDGAVDASDPKIAQKITEVADQVNANA